MLHTAFTTHHPLPSAVPPHLLHSLRSTFNNMCINYGVHKVNVSGVCQA